MTVQDREFVRRFEAFVVEPGSFDHRSHVRLAYIYLCKNDADTAHQKIRHALCAFLTHHGVDPSKYHETMTQACVLAVRHFMARTPDASSASAFIEANPKLLDSQIMLTHYSKELMFSDKARESFVEPDIDPILRYEDETH